VPLEQVHTNFRSLCEIASANRDDRNSEGRPAKTYRCAAVGLGDAAAEYAAGVELSIAPFGYQLLALVSRDGVKGRRGLTSGRGVDGVWVNGEVALGSS
jgi:hypothetical protein